MAEQQQKRVEYNKPAVVDKSESTTTIELDKDVLAIASAIIASLVDKHSMSHFITASTGGGRVLRDQPLQDAWLIAHRAVEIGRMVKGQS